MTLLIKSDAGILGSFGLKNVLDSATASELAEDYKSRVESDGGIVINEAYLNDICQFLVDNKLAGRVHTIVSASLGIQRDTAGSVTKLYNLIGGKDLVLTGFFRNTFSAVPVAGPPLSDIPLPVFTPGSRPCIKMRMGSTNTSALRGNAFVQHGQPLSATKTVDVFAVLDHGVKTAGTPSGPVSVVSFTENYVGSNNVFHGYVKAAFSAGEERGPNVLVHDNREDGAASGYGRFISYPNFDTKFTSNAATLDSVYHAFWRQTISGNEMGTYSKNQADSDEYTRLSRVNAPIEATDLFHGDPTLMLGASVGLFNSLAGRTSIEVGAVFGNWDIYDFFLMRDIEVGDTASAIRQFIEVRLKTAWGARGA